jgi:uncharacterized protein YndB with AHSA1/START domain
VGLVVIIAIIGSLLPRDHVATVTATIPASPEKVWAALIDVAAYPTWRSDVQRVELLTKPPASLSWREHSRQGTLTFVTETSEPLRRLVGRIADRNLPFGGAWEYNLAPEGADSARTRLTITERGYVSNPVFRFVSRFVMGHYATLESYMKALGHKFGADVMPTRV